MMDIRHRHKYYRLADVLITLTAVFLLLDATMGFTKHQVEFKTTALDVTSSNLSTSCIGGFSNQRTVDGVTQLAPHGMPFNAYQVTFTNIGNKVITIYNVTVELRDYGNNVFAQPQDTNLGNGSGITLNLGQSRTIVETTGASRPVASCQILGWQP
jgi:hypothetical protein